MSGTSKRIAFGISISHDAHVTVFGLIGSQRRCLVILGLLCGTLDVLEWVEDERGL